MTFSNTLPPRTKGLSAPSGRALPRPIHSPGPRSECEWGDGRKRFFFSTTLETNTINKSKRNREGSVYVTWLQRVPLFPRWARPVCLFICGDSGLHHSPFTRGTLNSFLRNKMGRGVPTHPGELETDREDVSETTGWPRVTPRAVSINLLFYSWPPREKMHAGTKAENHQLYRKKQQHRGTKSINQTIWLYFTWMILLRVLMSRRMCGVSHITAFTAPVSVALT